MIIGIIAVLIGTVVVAITLLTRRVDNKEGRIKMDFYEVINSIHGIRDFTDESIPKGVM